LIPRGNGKISFSASSKVASAGSVYYRHGKNAKEMDSLIRQRLGIMAALEASQDIDTGEAVKRQIFEVLPAAASFGLSEVKILTADPGG
jgi:hypothetical protein